ncbi:uncharacterized protein LOC130054918 [Ostrea edulis]|uniref:uncharacterized protein LOC130054918 n=1 Tax=Ostrea edulis TaxID=37623 RepID=UPI0024AF4175|nr:uncharacterized protein LOC130054918 [Ostrea edulis]
MSVEPGRRLLGSNFKSVNPIGPKHCLKLCFVHTDCLSVNVCRTRLLCELNSQQDSGTTTVTKGSPKAEDFIYIPRQSIPQDIISLTAACSTETCIVARMYKLQDVAKDVILRRNMATKVTATLSEEKLSAVRALFAYNGWDWDAEEEEVISEEVPSSPGLAIEGNAGRDECPDWEPPPGQHTSYVVNTSESYVGRSRGYACAVGTVPERVNQTLCLANGHWETPRCQG